MYQDNSYSKILRGPTVIIYFKVLLIVTDNSVDRFLSVTDTLVLRSYLHCYITNVAVATSLVLVLSQVCVSLSYPMFLHWFGCREVSAAPSVTNVSYLDVISTFFHHRCGNHGNILTCSVTDILVLTLYPLYSITYMTCECHTDLSCFRYACYNVIPCTVMLV